MEKHEKMLQEMLGYTNEQLGDEMEAIEEEWKRSGSPSGSKAQVDAGYSRMIEKMKRDKNR